MRKALIVFLEWVAYVAFVLPIALIGLALTALLYPILIQLAE